MTSGKTEAIFSGYRTTNSYEYRKAETLGFGETTITVHNWTGMISGFTTAESGVTYEIAGYPVKDFVSGYVILASGEIVYSGYFALKTLSDAYEEIRIGVKSTGTDISSVATVLVSRKRRQ